MPQTLFKKIDKKFHTFNSSMEFVEQKTRPIHNNFSSSPCFNVKWGRQKQLRCVKDYSFIDYSSSSSSKRRSPNDDDDGIEAMRERLMLDYRSEVSHMKAQILKKNENGGGVVVGGENETRPWNLRTRRTVCNSTAGVAAEISKSPPRRSGGDKPRVKYSACLSKREIEEDFLAMVDSRPARRPKKRPKFVQKQIDGLFPGYWLTEITADMYKVNENPEIGKR